MRYLFLIVIVLCGNIFVSAQNYPAWFFDQQIIPCSETAIGLADHSFNNDTTAIKIALKNAAINLAKQSEVYIHSKKSFWTTALGTAEMENNFTESYDTNFAISLLKTMTVIDTFLSGELVAILVSKNECEKSLSISTVFNENLQMPVWIKKIPQDSNYFYAVGSAPEYYYKTSSFNEAERKARYLLATTKNLVISSLQKSEYLVEEKREEITSIKIYNAQIISRWIDNHEKIIYVLLRMPKQ